MFQTYVLYRNRSASLKHILKKITLPLKNKQLSFIFKRHKGCFAQLEHEQEPVGGNTFAILYNPIDFDFVSARTVLKIQSLKIHYCKQN